LDAGLYIAVFELPKATRITVGRLGRFEFPAGLWFYVGSAQRNLSARLDRHARHDKPLRWHIDYLSVRARMLGAIVIAAGKDRECRIAAALARRLERPVPGFGACDCRCGGHLFHEAPPA